jgi:hypothetical protein
MPVRVRKCLCMSTHAHTHSLTLAYTHTHTHTDRSWSVVSSTLKNAAMRKKNLSKDTCYYFRVAPNIDNYSSKRHWGGTSRS